MGKVELLAPAGGYNTMVAAFNAGADAVYLGGDRFGARAYADNFSEEEVIRAIKYAHLHGKKIYMTINTLVKESEISALHDYLEPFDKAGLDGVIVQDFGVFKYIRENFPGIELHASTQMTLTGQYGAKYLKGMGATRIVPARELTLSEIKNIKSNEDIEIESFIHGAMCYCYSGACLFSSMLGSRSGNRGRCAQPCRLPYTTDNSSKELYPLSLKDMCTVYDIPDLIDAGIDSFKIEGRMKSPEYAAGVTYIYRKYIDKYYENGREGFLIDEEDLRILKTLYLRTEIGNGYYFRHNGKEMVTLTKPGYNGTDDEILEQIRNEYITGEHKIPVSAYCYIKKDEPIIFTLSTDKYSYTVTGDVVEGALKRPTTFEDVKKQLSKFGNTFFEETDITVDLDTTGGEVFLPVKALNELRRNAVLGLENEIIKGNGLRECATQEPQEKEAVIAEGYSSKKPEKSPSQVLDVLISDNAQLTELVNYLRDRKKTAVNRIYLESRLVLSENINSAITLLNEMCDIYVALPFITRQEENAPDIKDIANILSYIQKHSLKGVLARNVEQISLLSELKAEVDVITDYGLYIWNSLAASEFKDSSDKNGLNICSMSVPLELTRREAIDLAAGIGSGDDLSYQIYGYTPMMVTANCLNKTLKSCTMKRGEHLYGISSFTDRQNHNLPYSFDCRYCMNIIWNAVPVSLHKQLKDILSDGIFGHLRIDFTIEKANDMPEIIEYFDEMILRGVSDLEPTYEYTTGHYKRVTE